MRVCESKTIHYEFGGTAPTQSQMDRLFAEVKALESANLDTLVELRLTGIPVHQFPRLIVDHGDLIHRIAARLAETERPA